MITYRSTRGNAPELGFADVLLAGLASDGGLYVPSDVPELDPDLDPDATYPEVAVSVMWPFVEGSIDRADFVAMVHDSYRSFRSPEVCPVREMGHNHFLLDLSQGPTLAFKDVALQMVGRLLDHELERRGRKVTVIGATSGDTGSAAIEALANRSNINVVIMFPEGRVSDVQRRQMTTVDAPNVQSLAVQGTFDDCQDLVKAAFASDELRQRSNLAAVNSINWARVMCQIVYYVTSARQVAPDGSAVSFCVPTGNFGNILAGYYAKRMGLPVDRLVIASNRNDVLTRAMETGMLKAETVEPSLSPSMDIQISSNFERLLFESSGGDAEGVTDLLATFRASGEAEIPEEWLERIRTEFDAGKVDDDATLAEMKRVHEDLEMLVDPHTAVGLRVARTLRQEPDVAMITLGTADPAKFPDAVEKATGIRPPLPDHMSELFTRTEHVQSVAADLSEIQAFLPTV